MTDGAYLDNAASTAMLPEAVEAMLPFLTERYANPTGAHAMARDARRALDDARDQVAGCFGVGSGDVVFTGGGTESDNLAVLGVLEHRGGTAVTTSVEHPAVLAAVESSGGVLVDTDANGVVDLDALAAALTPEVSVVSVMAANNETGVVQPLAEVAAVVRKHAPGAVVHTDAVQAFCWLDVAELATHADLLSISAHKFGGPKGVGALIARPGTEFAPRQVGGGQERERRAGTPNVAGAVAMGVAAQITAAERDDAVARIGPLRDRLAAGLVAAVPNTSVTAAGAPRIAGTCHVCFDGLRSEALLVLLEREQVYASAASSCASGAMTVSHVLEAMGVAPSLGGGSLRLSLGHRTTAAEIDHAVAAIPRAVERLRLFDG
jgi:cysteine desulfurase